MDWNSFNRELQNRVSDPGTRYMLGLIYERLLDISKQTDAAGGIMLAFAETIKGFVELSETQDARVKDLHKMVTGQVDGVSLQSVPITNDDLN